MEISPSLNSDHSYSEDGKGEINVKKKIGPSLPSDVQISQNVKCSDRNKRRNRKKLESKDVSSHIIYDVEFQHIVKNQ